MAYTKDYVTTKALSVVWRHKILPSSHVAMCAPCWLLVCSFTVLPYLARSLCLRVPPTYLSVTTRRQDCRAELRQCQCRARFPLDPIPWTGKKKYKQSSKTIPYFTTSPPRASHTETSMQNRRGRGSISPTPSYVQCIHTTVCTT